MRSTITILMIVSSFCAFAQEKLSIVQQAMRDEMERNLKELKSEGFEKPFFINYTLLDETSVTITATLGALTNSVETKNRAALSTRMLVGDYDFNDESLDNNLFSPPQANSIDLPLDDDYLGIRRSLWVSTDNIYRNASRQFAKNKELLKEQNKPLAEVPHRSFAKVPASKIDITAPEVKFDRTAVEEYVRKVSAVFVNYPDLISSNIAFVYKNGYRYLVNSEGSTNRVPVGDASFMISAGVRTSEGGFVFDNIIHRYATPELPPIEKVIDEAKQLAERILAKSKAPSMQETYVGPVLFEDEEVAGLMVTQLFSGEDNVMASNGIPSLKGFSYEQKNTMDKQIGKPLFNEGLTVKAVPKMKKFGTETLFGSFEVDEEGVIPADETVIIENGVLKVLLNDRTITKPGQVANGLGDGPGVVQVSFKTTVPTNTLKTKLIDQAKKDGLDYALIVRSNTQTTGGATNVYKVYVDDGREELVREVGLKELSRRNFRKVLGASNEMSVYHLGQERSTLSVICPKAILLEEVEFTNQTFATMKDEEYVPSPLKK